MSLISSSKKTKVKNVEFEFIPKSFSDQNLNLNKYNFKKDFC